MRLVNISIPFWFVSAFCDEKKLYGDSFDWEVQDVVDTWIFEVGYQMWKDGKLPDKNVGPRYLESFKYKRKCEDDLRSKNNP